MHDVHDVHDVQVCIRRVGRFCRLLEAFRLLLADLYRGDPLQTIALRL